MNLLGLTLLLIALAGVMWLIFGRKARTKREIASSAAERAVKRQFEPDDREPGEDGDENAPR